MKKMLVAIMVLLPAAAFAHVGDHSLINWRAGFLHPISGLDHLLALLAVGLWLAQSEIRGRVSLVTAFGFLMAVAIAAGTKFTQITFEGGIIATLVVLGGVLACALRGPTPVRAAIVGLTALVHGFVHGTELPTGDGVVPFAVALIVSSVLIVSVAAAAGAQGQKFGKGVVVRIAGALLIFFGVGSAF